MAAKRDTDDSAAASAPWGRASSWPVNASSGSASPATASPAIREELVRRNLPFAKRLALRYRGASESFDDLLQVASLGLVNAVDRFDPERGIPFTAFASPTILGELKRHFRDRVWTVRVPRGLHDRMAEVDKAITELTKKLQRSPSVGEIAERLELEQTDVLEVLEANHNRRPLSLDRPAGARGLRRGAARRSGSATRTRASSWSRDGSRSTRRCPTSTSASAWSCACASSRT